MEAPGREFVTDTDSSVLKSGGRPPQLPTEASHQTIQKDFGYRSEPQSQECGKSFFGWAGSGPQSELIVDQGK